jgi:hypothetical protein
MLSSIRDIVCQAIVPFERQPPAIDDLPEPDVQVTESHLKECQWIFDQADARRIYLEQKAQSAFALMLFLVPLLASLFAFLIKASSHTTSRTVAIGFLAVSGVLGLLGFISVVRAVSVKNTETLFLGAVVDLKDGQFRQYDYAFHARGLLYCASINTAMNDHIAMFVKSGQVLTAGAVIALVIAAIPAGIAFSSLAQSATDVKIVTQVNASIGELVGLREEVANLRKEITALANGKAAHGAPKPVNGRGPASETNRRRPAKKGTPVGFDKR